MSSAEPLGLEEARRRLRELGYLNGRVERFLFRRAFEGRGGLFLPAIAIGAAGAALAAVAAVESTEPGFGSSRQALLALWTHVFLADLPVAAILASLMVLWADRSRSPESAATVAGLAAAAALFVLWIGGVWGLAREIPPPALLWGAPVAIAALFLARSVRSGLLARAYAHSRVLPSRPRRRVFFALAVVGILCAVAIFASRREPAPVPPPRPSPRTGAVVVVGIDGMGLDGLPAGSATGIRELLARGRLAWWPAQAASPPETWTDLATGEPASVHGVRALERVRPSGSPLALRAPLGTAWYLKGLGPRLSLVSTAPVSARDRRSLAFWEVAASAGLPAVAVGWWASGPWPGADVVGNDQVLSAASDGASADRQAIAVFLAKRNANPAVQTVYLPGPDILRKDDPAHRAALTEIQRFLEDEISRAAPRGDALVVLAVDSHPPPGALGRMVVYDGDVSPRTLRGAPQDVGPSLLARAGIPVSRDLPGHPLAPLFRDGSLETADMPTYGPRIAPEAPPSPRADRSYLEKLKSLGYLN